MAKNEVRIIGGKWKGRKLSFPESSTLRPTLNRVRETLFNWLVADIENADCLDLFAGSGALGFEAMSRGARKVTFVDNHHLVVKALRKNLIQLLGNKPGGNSATIYQRSASQFLNRRPAMPKNRWTLIFLDPPFDSDEIERALAAISTRNLLAEHGKVYVELRKHTALDHSGWEFVKSSKAGDSRFGLLAREF